MCWKADELVSLGTAISDFVASQSVQEALKQWAAHTALAGALVASFAWPLVALSAMAPVDNAWSVALQRAEVTGALLARLIQERRLQDRPVSLLGYSLGAKAIFCCLQLLASSGHHGAIEDVYLVGGPMSASDHKAWRQARSVVSGRFVNGFASRDAVLGIIYRATHLDTPAGLSPVCLPGVEDVDLSRLIKSHSEYASKMDDCVAAMRV